MDQEISMMPPTPGRRKQTSTGHIPKPSLTRKADRSPSTPLDDMIGKINLLWKTVSEKLNDASPPENAGNSMAPKSIPAISHDEREELRKKGIKSPKYLSPTSIKELNKNPRGKEQGKEENEMETDMEVDEVIEEEEIEFETDEEVEEILEEEEDEEDGENFNLFPTIEELTHHEWLLKNPQPP
ncbi:hypothetical protein Tco_0854528 [Tanacetum coccineum]